MTAIHVAALPRKVALDYRSTVGWVEFLRNPSSSSRASMTRYRRNFVPGGSYFFTVNLADRRSLLLTEHIELLRTAFRDVKVAHPFTVEATVVLPDHLHALWTLPEGDADFAMRWRQIKAAFSRGLHLANAFRAAGQPKASAESGNDAIGSTRCAMNSISSGMWTTFTSTRSSTVM
jgi:REP element-mobilizing transposase RayT